ncbi:fimbrial isopeptide formation D2 domain-containing protein [Propionibacterium sp. oral taxon 192 str. F0372]|uniref:SpaH/EbpB family LPXTG-anchored major pilin n=1 Tax=Propionibacterium sp. oral taxon 192 TaxID=671222 RepID=UPI0003536E2E|nr:SpaH/EbpB family LPXTG-anchored major pilin [Propionibacterium sp. oral taxon 192]EPH03749.1 fimbrial isopeptide formation D2 domain-containing protein [Propionibacterium sp. oral taxon 192 str. F0372]
MSTTTRVASRVAAGIGALAIGLLGFPNVASADLGAGNINPDTQGSLIIHKQESGSQATSGSVTGTPDTQGTPVAGVKFTAYKITNLDLTQQASWNGLKDYTVPADACGGGFAPPKLTLPAGGAATFDSGHDNGLTNAQGEVTIGQLPVGAYLVCETLTPANVLKKAAPFLVTIPFPNNTVNNDVAGANGEWLYDVNVYPKNTVVQTPTKGIDVSAHGLQTGGQVTFPVEVTVPSIAEGDQFKYFVINDDLDGSLTEGKVVSVQAGGVDVDAAYYTKTEGDPVSVGFTKDGLAWLKTQPNAKITVTFSAKVNSIPANGIIPNIAELYLDTVPGDTPPDTPPTTPPPGTPPTTPTNKVEQSWGAAQIVKKDADNAKALSGASFQIYESDAPYAGACGTTKTGDPISINGVDTFTSDADGIVSIAGLFVDKGQANYTGKGRPPGPPGGGQVPQAQTNRLTRNALGDYTFANTEWENGNTHRCYVLVETAAPAGYVLPTGGKELTALKVVPGSTATASTVDINNTKQDVPGLPLTGGSGQVVMLTGGLVMIVAAGALVLARRRHVQA